MEKREWLVSKGLAKPGRGKFSDKAKRALAKAEAEGMVFDDPKANKVATVKRPKPEPKVVVKVEPKPAPVKQVRIATPTVKRQLVRQQTMIFGVDEGTNGAHSKTVIAFDSCAGCGKPIQYCAHDEPKLPNWIKGNGKVYFERPAV
jgi:hypothetical protein